MQKDEGKGFLDYFDDLKDPRIERKKLYPMHEILLLTLCGVICGCEGWDDIEAFGKIKLKFLRKFLPYENGIPSDDTLRRFFRAINPKVFQKCFSRWASSLGFLGRIISVDGKALRGSADKSAGKKAITMVSAFASEARLVLAQEKVDDKSNEITAIPNLLELLDLHGAIVTIDAMGCQKSIALKIREKKSDYVLSLKGNHSDLHDDVRTFFTLEANNNFKDISHTFAKTIDGDHGRIETRECYVTSADWLSQKHEWEGLKSIVMVKRKREIGNKVATETRYFLTSLDSDASQMLHVIRSHWSIENSLHWVLDVSFGEDQSRIRKGNAPQNIAIIRHIALNMIRKHKQKRQSIKLLRKRAGWDNATLEAILMQNF